MRSHPAPQTEARPVAGLSWWDAFFSKSKWGLAALIVGLTVIAYLPATHSGFIWDDNDYVTENSTLHDWHGLKRIWFERGAVPQYYPLVHTSFWLEYHVWGLNASGYHTVNVLLHALSVILLWCVLIRLRLPGAGLAAAIFALHPIGVESVAWITERKNVLSAVCYFSAALAYLRFAKFEIPPATNQNKSSSNKLWYFLALLFFAGAMFSKTVTCSLPAALLLVCWWKKGRVTIRDVLPLLPFFIVGIALGLQTAWIEKHGVGAQGAEWSLTFLERCLIAGRALWFYAGKLIWPVNLSFIYPRWEINVAVWWQWLFPLAALAVVVALWAFRSRIGRGPLVAVLFFAGTLFPALGFFNVYPMRFSFVADHFQYLASVGLIGLAAVALIRIPQKILLILLLVLAVLTWRQARIYHDVQTVWSDTLTKNPTCWLAHYNLGSLLELEGKNSEAEMHYRESARLNPDHEAHNNLGYVLEREGRTDEAEAHYRESLRLKPDHESALNNLGHLLLGRGQLDEAKGYFEQALQAKPGYVSAIANLGTVLVMQNDLTEAIAVLRSGLVSNPGNAELLSNLAAAYGKNGDYAASLRCCDQALQIKPELTYPRIIKGKVLVQLGRVNEAVEQFQQVLRSDPGNFFAQNELAQIRAAQGGLLPGQ